MRARKARSDALGPGAHVTALRRTRVGALDVSEAVRLDALDGDHLTGHLLTPRQWADRTLPCLECPDDATRRTRMGQRLSWEELACDEAPVGTFALVRREDLVAVAEVTPEGPDAYRLLRVFVGPPAPEPPAVP